MKNLIIALLLATFSFNTATFAQMDKDEIRQLIADAPFVEALGKMEGEEGLIACYWIVLLAAYGAEQQAFQATGELRAWSEEEDLKNANEGYYCLAYGLASAGKLTEAVAVLRKFPSGDETEARQILVGFMATFSDCNNVLAEAQKIDDVKERDETLKEAVEEFCSRTEINQAQQLIGYFSTSKEKEAAQKLISEAEERIKIEKEHPLITPEELRSLADLESDIRTAMSKTREEERNEMFDSIATDLAKHRDFKRARLIANQITNPLTRLSAYNEILGEAMGQAKPLFAPQSF